MKNEVQPDGDFATLVFERLLKHPPEHVWDAISTPEGLREWLMCTQARIDARVGGTIELVSGPAQYRSRGRILAWEPPRLLEYEWKVDAVTEMPLGQDAVFRFELEPQGDATRLRVVYRRITHEVVSGYFPVTQSMLARLEAQLDGVPPARLPDGMRPKQENDIFHAVAHPARRAILLALRRGDTPASALAAPFDMSFAAVSQHLKVLKDAALVIEARDGRQRVYRLTAKPLSEVAAWASQFEDFFNRRLDALELHLDRKHGKRGR